tara:strand:- start:192 stop:563 length:372 start_codon:yes stop_codon:yes gene_type:complete
MAKTSSLVLLSEQDFDASSTTVPITGTEQKAAGYYSSAGDLQTVAIFTEDFNGTIKVQATLDTTLGTNSFFDVFTFSNDGSSANDSTARFFNSVTNVSGRFTFMRAVVTEFSQGTINKVLLSY